MKPTEQHFDVRPPSLDPKDKDKGRAFFARGGKKTFPDLSAKNPHPWRRTKIFLILIFVLIGIYFVRAVYLRSIAQDSFHYIYAQLQEARSALKDFDPEAAKEAFVGVDTELKAVESRATKYGFWRFTSFWGKFLRKFEGLPNTFSNLSSVSESAIAISDDIAFLKENAFSLMITDKGAELIAQLQNTRRKLVDLSGYIDVLQEDYADFIPEGEADMLKLRASLFTNADILTALIDFLQTKEERHLAIIFQNPSEMRPGGGFIGSYADIGLTNGNLTTLKVNDIYDPDGQLDLKIAPPEPLQTITPIWEARDANWFFDFPTSAKKVLFFLNNSKIYTESEVKFEAAIAVNTDFISDIFELVGSIELTDYDITLTAENFLEEIQREVESGEDKIAGEPKRILKVLTPILFDRLNDLNPEKRNQFIQTVERHLDVKNMMVYFEDKALQFYVKSVGIAGDVFMPRRDTLTEYLAVVNANIGGHKTDAFIDQEITLQSSIGIDGKIFNELTITRKHTGNTEKAWWYNALNKNYLQIFTTLASQAIITSGRSLWPDLPTRIDSDYQTDPEIEEINKSLRYLADLGLDRFIAHNKTVFAAWFNTRPGKTETFLLEYINPKTVSLSEGVKIPYQFVFERQSGARTNLSVLIEAPAGYIFTQTGKKFFEYFSDDPPGRLVIPLTIQFSQ